VCQGFKLNDMSEHRELRAFPVIGSSHDQIKERGERKCEGNVKYMRSKRRQVPSAHSPPPPTSLQCSPSFFFSSLFFSCCCCLTAGNCRLDQEIQWLGEKSECFNALWHSAVRRTRDETSGERLHAHAFVDLPRGTH